LPVYRTQYAVRSAITATAELLVFDSDYTHYVLAVLCFMLQRQRRLIRLWRSARY